LSEPKGEFWVCSATNFRMVKNSFQRAKGCMGNSPSKYHPPLLDVLHPGEGDQIQAHEVLKSLSPSGARICNEVTQVSAFVSGCYPSDTNSEKFPRSHFPRFVIGY
jgi:hypothetical protein